MENTPYHLGIGSLSSFVEHRHADIEFNYCIKGTRDVIIDRKRYTLSEGDISVVAPGVSHEFPPSEDPDRLVLTVIVGSSFLKKHFSAFSSSDFRSRVISSAKCKTGSDLKHALDSIVRLSEAETVRSSLLITGELYKVCAFLLDECSCSKNDESGEPDPMTLESIDKALDLIYYDYKRSVTVDEAANVTGYGKSNFCKIFKKTTGMTFHEALNKRRISLACGLLLETGLSVSEIAEEVGFCEVKSFCRVFKATEGVTPGTYRRQRK